MARGRMADAVRTWNWSATPLGRIEQWPEPLLAHVNLALSFPIPAVVHWGPEMHMVFNDAYAELLGPEGHTYLGQSAPIVWKPLWPQIESLYSSVRRTGESISGNDLLIPVDRDGTLRDVFWSYAIAPIHHQQTVAGIFNTARDTTATVASFNALVQSDERLRLALSASDCIGIWDWHIPSDIIHAEQDFALFYGQDPQRARLGIPRTEYFEKVHPDDRVPLDDALWYAIQNFTEVLADYRLLPPDGSVRWVQAKGRCFYAEDGSPTRFSGISIDITRRKIAEAALAETRMTAAAQPPKVALAPKIEAPLASIATILRLARSTDDLTEVQRFLVVAEREVNRIADLACPPAESTSDAPQSAPAPILPPATPTLLWHMEILVSTIARSLAERKDDVRVSIMRRAEGITFLLQVAADDLARVLGPQGRTAQSMRSLLDAAGIRSNQQFSLDIEAT
ncbi:KH domain-containing protein [Granulicella tundricola]|uniref:RNA-binding protein KhpA n=1 Tax=Granulicella tundricola (strain ATCC BAA-1859 / DSM 23138 / MP5ACTX9) TaxID=1198114 RepID=E8WY49_GRATM|nr:KH domain-containing protein [Granulicella tundricola]ADW68676.1 putative PAS/PAC sensor protein [Granulicella tundricola MP5ACTX9]